MYQREAKITKNLRKSLSKGGINTKTSYFEGHPLFFVYGRKRFLIFGSIESNRKKKTKIKLEREFGARRPVPQHNICGDWKQQGVSAK